MNIQSMRIAFRNITRQKKRTVLLGGAIGFGFMIVMLINSFTAGFVTTVEENFSAAFGGHLYVSGTEVSDRGSEILVMSNPEPVFNALKLIEDEIESYSLRSSTRATLIFGSTEVGQQLVGVNFEDEEEFFSGLTFVEGSPESVHASKNGIILSKEIADELGVEVGESVILKASTVTGQTNTGDVIIAATIVDQGSFGMSSGYAEMETLNTLLGMEADEFQSINIYLKDLDKLDSVTSLLYQEIKAKGVVESREAEEDEEGMAGHSGPRGAMMFGASLNSVDEADQWEGTKFTITNINDIMEEIVQLVVVLDNVGTVIFIIILLITMIGIMNSYRMVMIERTQEIGTMRAIGVQRNGVKSIFLYEALFIALIGALAGLILSMIVMGIVGAIPFGSEGFAMMFLLHGHLNFELALGITVRNLILVCIMSLAAVYLPARAASKLEPAEALRTSY